MGEIPRRARTLRQRLKGRTKPFQLRFFFSNIPSNDFIKKWCSLTPGASLDFSEFQTELHEVKRNATNEQDHVALLQLHDIISKFMERNVVEQEKLQSFKELRDKDYKLLLIYEALDGEYISPDKISAVTSREVAACRMSPEDKFHQLALAGAMILGKP